MPGSSPSALLPQATRPTDFARPVPGCGKEHFAGPLGGRSRSGLCPGQTLGLKPPNPTSLFSGTQGWAPQGNDVCAARPRFSECKVPQLLEVPRGCWEGAGLLCTETHSGRAGSAAILPRSGVWGRVPQSPASGRRRCLPWAHLSVASQTAKAQRFQPWPDSSRAPQSPHLDQA